VASRDSDGRASSRRTPGDSADGDGEARDANSDTFAADPGAPTRELASPTMREAAERGGDERGRRSVPDGACSTAPTPVLPSDLSGVVSATSRAPIPSVSYSPAADATASMPAPSSSTLARLLDRLAHPPAASDAPWRLELDTRDASLGIVQLEHHPESGWRIALRSHDPDARRATPEQLSQLCDALREHGHRVERVEQAPDEGAAS